MLESEVLLEVVVYVCNGPLLALSRFLILGDRFNHIGVDRTG